MTYTQQDLDVLGTWTDQLNHALHPLDILLSGVDAMSILGLPKSGSVLEKLRSATDEEIVSIAEAANRYCETDRIEAGHIRLAIERSKWHWQGV